MDKEAGKKPYLRHLEMLCISLDWGREDSWLQVTEGSSCGREIDLFLNVCEETALVTALLPPFKSRSVCKGERRFKVIRAEGRPGWAAEHVGRIWVSLLTMKKR